MRFGVPEFFGDERSGAGDNHCFRRSAKYAVEPDQGSDFSRVSHSYSGIFKCPTIAKGSPWFTGGVATTYSITPENGARTS